ncbi:hypothetical protein J3R83DRAFT_13042 [Lanmaoa asiatica]|nr:hypothetical protein J3R83DRAFT_13042 [Lanmaoa asiatica]
MQAPPLDLQNATSTDPVLYRALAAEIRSACVNVGFFYVKNHGISEAVIQAAVNGARRFFLLPTATKIKLDIHATPNFKGYTALLGENTNPNNKGDLHEGFDIGWESIDHSTQPYVNGPMTGANIWPENLPGFREDILAYYHAAVKLGQSLFPLFAVALDLPENFFDDKACLIRLPAAIMRLLHYPPQPASPLEGVQGIGAHTEYCFTILWQDNVPALQVMNTSGNWIDAVPIPGCLVVNLGDQFARWTNDVFKSTLHRAINASGQERGESPRLQVPLLSKIAVEPIPGCVTEDNPAKYEVVTAGDYVKSRLEATYAHSK